MTFSSSDEVKGDAFNSEQVCLRFQLRAGAADKRRPRRERPRDRAAKQRDELAHFLPFRENLSHRVWCVALTNTTGAELKS